MIVLYVHVLLFLYILVDITFYFDTEHLRVFTSFRNLLLMQEIKADVTDRIMTHDKPVVASRLSKINNQVFNF